MLASPTAAACLLLSLVVLGQALKCPPAHYEAHTLCLPCSSLLDTSTEQNGLVPNECDCDDGYQWSKVEKHCLPLEGVEFENLQTPRRLQTPTCTNTQFLSSKGVCTNCPTGSGYSGGSDKLICKCDAAKKFAWSTAFEACVCDAGFYGLNNSCLSCPETGTV